MDSIELNATTSSSINECCHDDEVEVARAASVVASLYGEDPGDRPTIDAFHVALPGRLRLSLSESDDSATAAATASASDASLGGLVNSSSCKPAASVAAASLAVISQLEAEASSREDAESSVAFERGYRLGYALGFCDGRVDKAAENARQCPIARQQVEKAREETTEETRKNNHPEGAEARVLEDKDVPQPDAQPDEADAGQESPTEDADASIESPEVAEWLSAPGMSRRPGDAHDIDVRQLKGLLRLRLGAGSRGTDLWEGRQNAMMLKHFVMSSAVVAVERANELRASHPHCSDRPLTQSFRLCLLAANMANELAMKADAEEPLSMGNVAKVTIRTDGEIDIALSLGLAACRLDTANIDSLPCQSIDYWYRKGKSFPYDEVELAYDDPMYHGFSQLLDASSRHMGWGAAQAEDGAAFAVALFDHLGSMSTRALRKLRPPFGWTAADAESSVLSRPTENPYKIVGKQWSQLNSVMDYCNNIVRSFDPRFNDERNLADALQLTGVAACQQINAMRRLHGRRPVELSLALCTLAVNEANNMAVEHRQFGAEQDTVKSMLESDILEVVDFNQTYGLVASLSRVGDKVLASLYEEGKSFPYGDVNKALSQTGGRRYATLMGLHNHEMGWGVALSAGDVVITVAIFDSVGSTHWASVETLKPAKGSLEAEDFTV